MDQWFDSVEKHFLCGGLALLQCYARCLWNMSICYNCCRWELLWGKVFPVQTALSIPSGKLWRIPTTAPRGLYGQPPGICFLSMPHAQLLLAMKTPGGCSQVFQSFPGGTERAVHAGEGAGGCWIQPVGQSLETAVLEEYIWVYST